VDYADGMGWNQRLVRQMRGRTPKPSARVRYNKSLKQRVSVPTASTFQRFNVLAPNRLLQLQRLVVQLGAIKFLILR
jgi:hypothetical protein